MDIINEVLNVLESQRGYKVIGNFEVPKNILYRVLKQSKFDDP